MITPTIPNLSPVGSPPLRILPRPAWQAAARHVVRRLLGSAALAALVCLAIVLTLTWIGAPGR